MRKLGCLAALTLLALLLPAAPAHADVTWRTLTPRFTWAGNGVSTISASSPTNIWVGGYQGNVCLPLCLGDKVALQRFDGTSWTSHTPPGMELSGSVDVVEAVSPDQAWAFRRSTSTSNASLARWHGTYWSSLPLPATHVADVAFDAQGGWATSGGVVHRLQGTTWTTSLTLDKAALNSVEALSATDVWVSGTQQVDGQLKPFVWRWDGSAWTRQTVPEIAGRTTAHSLHVVSPTEAWAAIYSEDAKHEQHVVRWDGTTWNLDFKLSPEWFAYPWTPCAEMACPTGRFLQSSPGFTQTADGTMWGSFDDDLYRRVDGAWTRQGATGPNNPSLTSIPGTDTLLVAGPEFSVKITP
jgi:hypothetical protein